jgi:hypothetical protein
MEESFGYRRSTTPSSRRPGDGSSFSSTTTPRSIFRRFTLAELQLMNHPPHKPIGIGSRLRPAVARARQHRLGRIWRGPRPGGTFDSSPLRSGESRFFKGDPSRQGRSIGCLRLRGRMRAKDRGFDRPFRDGAIFNPFSHHFVVGCCYRMSLRVSRPGDPT